MDPKPERRHRDLQLMRQLHLEGDCCEICGCTWGLTLHHLRRRPQGGGDTRDNLVMLCMGPGTSDCHGKLHAGDATVRADIERIEAERGHS